MGRAQNESNLKTEKEGIQILRGLMDGFIVPSKEERVKLYGICGIDYGKYYKSVDGIRLLVPDVNQVKSAEDFLFIEIKTTKAKNVTRLPYKVFFGFTENEETLFKAHANYRLCIVHPILNEYYLLDFEEYERMIHNKRIQYQIDFRAE
jgi:hypothetical protein